MIYFQRLRPPEKRKKALAADAGFDFQCIAPTRLPRLCRRKKILPAIPLFVHVNHFGASGAPAVAMAGGPACKRRLAKSGGNVAN
jgi:hypothetical protein